MGIIIGIVVLVMLWSFFTESEEGKVILFLGIVAILGFFGSLILSFLKYVSYVAILLMLLVIGVAIYKKLFGE